MGRIIAVANQKGGVGKTSTCVNLAAGIALKGKKVLICDIDLQGNATTGLGITKSKLKNSIYSVLLKDVPAKDAIIKTCVENLFLLPSNVDLETAEDELAHSKNKGIKLKEALKSIGGEFDYIFIDCPPAIGYLMANALVASDGVLIPIQSEYYAMEGLSQLMNTIKGIQRTLNPSLVIEGVLITMYDGRALISREIKEEITKYFGKKLFNTVIPRNIRISEAPSYGVPVLLHDKKCKGTIAYNALVEEFLGR